QVEKKGNGKRRNKKEEEELKKQLDDAENAKKEADKAKEEAEKLPLDANHVNTEEARLKYRYLDLRRPEMAQRLKTRAKITSLVRR
ncbi:hypothetical protein MJL81_28840, partial [Salmonella enterica subsp. enterica serovar Anatum]|nr:hypothetical protein [Salmonella enterica subsp. enterica serovar Anatum]